MPVVNVGDMERTTLPAVPVVAKSDSVPALLYRKFPLVPLVMLVEPTAKLALAVVHVGAEDAPCDVKTCPAVPKPLVPDRAGVVPKLVDRPMAPEALMTCALAPVAPHGKYSLYPLPDPTEISPSWPEKYMPLLML